MSPNTFIASPGSWLRAIHQKSGTIGVAPNFGYQLCIDRARGLDAEKIDLSAWRCALVGSEMVTENTVAGFVEKFGPFGFRKEAFMPVYGLAEATLAVCFTPPNTGPLIDQVNLRGLVTKGIAEPAGNGEGNTSFVSVGKHVPGVEVKVVDQTGTEVSERVQGRLLTRSSSVMSEYFNNPVATSEVLRDGWLDTGDLAYRVDGYIFVTGRSKDVIIKAGRNYNPEHIEQAVWSVPGIRKHSVAAFGILSREKGTENIVVMAEAKIREKEEVGKLVLAINQAVSKRVELTPDEVVIVQPRTIPKTTSGKVQRALCRLLYLKGKAGR
jgi:acyl-CoA synthetase (AMP-forming)/AMP-acid ligase II